MKTKHLLTSDGKLEKWGYGEWVEEPDEATFEHVGFRCLIRRQQNLGHLCGYIHLSPNHPWFGKNYNDIETEVHGGLTYAEYEGEDSLIGFDCAHAYDLSPHTASETLQWEKLKSFVDDGAKAAIIRIQRNITELRTKYFPLQTYRNINFCIEECKKLAEQAQTASTSQQFSVPTDPSL